MALPGLAPIGRPTLNALAQRGQLRLALHLVEPIEPIPAPRHRAGAEVHARTSARLTTRRDAKMRKGLGGVGEGDRIIQNGQQVIVTSAQMWGTES